MRVIAGSARGIRLRSPSTDGTRPILDRAKEALFNILNPALHDARFLDLFAGTGGVGIEALSRGAASATFVEKSREIVDDLRFNLDRTRLADLADVQQADVFHFLRRTPTPFDVVYVSPPQWLDLWEPALRALDEEPGWLADDAIIVVQHDPTEDAELELANLERYDTRRYAKVQLVFYRRR